MSGKEHMGFRDIFGIKVREKNEKPECVERANTDRTPYEIKVMRSGKRKRTISARLVGNVMVVHAPARIPEADLEKIIDKFKKSFEKKQFKRKLNDTKDLGEIAERLNNDYFNGSLNIKSIEYVTSQSRSFGSCSCRMREIRLSHRLTKMPDWVRDYVIIHEMAHLIEPNHSKSFWSIVSRYGLAERARGYLLAKGINEEENL